MLMLNSLLPELLIYKTEKDFFSTCISHKFTESDVSQADHGTENIWVYDN